MGDWTETTTTLNDHRGDIIRTVYLSPKFQLLNGGSHFTLNPTYHMPVPEGDYVIVNQSWDIVEGDSDRQTPLTEMYDHHWLIGGVAECVDHRLKGNKVRLNKGDVLTV